MLWVEVIINSCCGRGSEYDSKMYDGYIGKSNKNKNGRVGGSQAVIHSFCGELGGWSMRLLFVVTAKLIVFTKLPQ